MIAECNALKALLREVAYGKWEPLRASTRGKVTIERTTRDAIQKAIGK
jgi:hypothetical protein